MRVSEYYKLGKTQPFLDFVDIRLDTDIEVFVDPTALRGLSSTWGHECNSLVQTYFEAVLKKIKAGKDDDARKLISSLRERNEFHLGFSKGKSQGRAFGAGSAQNVWEALARSKAAKSGLLTDLEDTCLLIEGIGCDMVSDAVCNIIRGPLISYTQNACKYYGIPLTDDVASGPIWNPKKEVWESSLIPLPMTKSGCVILVPKIIVRHRISYDYGEYYTHYLLPEMQQVELSANTALVELLKNGKRRVTKKSLREKYGSDKLAVVEQTIKHPHVLNEYKENKKKTAPPPLDHEKLSEIEDTTGPDWDELIVRLKAIPTGTTDAKRYENLIEEILSALFYPSLCSPTKEHEIHDGRKRIDITYTNEAQAGFFRWVSSHYAAAFVFVECKNYGGEIGNPALDQLSGRFSPSRGKFGIQICRSLKNPKLFEQRCIDTAKDDRGYIVALTDDDVIKLMMEAKKGITSHAFPLLMKKFRKLVD